MSITEEPGEGNAHSGICAGYLVTDIPTTTVQSLIINILSN